MKYDLICSLGGCCAPAMQIRQRNLQEKTLPFDWLFHVDDNQFKALSDAFRTDFKEWLQKENMEELFGVERGTSENYQYKDNLTGFRYIHDFKKPIDDTEHFSIVRKKYKKRFERFLELVESAETILFVSDAGKWNPNFQNVIQFKNGLLERWPDKKIDITITIFNAIKNESVTRDGVTFLYFIRPWNEYDFSFTRTNYEWHFLDEIELSSNSKKYSKIRKIYNQGIRISFLKKMPPIFFMQFKIIDFSITLRIGRG